MKHKQLGNTFVLLLSTGERVMESITAFCMEKKITAAHFTAIGAVSEVFLQPLQGKLASEHDKKTGLKLMQIG